MIMEVGRKKKMLFLTLVPLPKLNLKIWYDWKLEGKLLIYIFIYFNKQANFHLIDVKYIVSYFQTLNSTWQELSPS